MKTDTRLARSSYSRRLYIAIGRSNYIHVKQTLPVLFNFTSSIPIVEWITEVNAINATFESTVSRLSLMARISENCLLIET